ncbi:MAG: hypothetical protein IKJ68_09100 [Clostridia bacterium]|nr:hypothetical protein [Clostridia bacterium]
MYVAAHRGWSEKFPENTIEAFRAAIKNGAQLITCNNPDEFLELLRRKGYHK